MPSANICANTARPCATSCASPTKGAPRARHRHPARLQSARPDLPDSPGPCAPMACATSYDICPELYETKFEARRALWRAMRLFEAPTFTALVSIATNATPCRRAAAWRRRTPSWCARARGSTSSASCRPTRSSGAAGASSWAEHAGPTASRRGSLRWRRWRIPPMGRQDIQFGIVGDGGRTGPRSRRWWWRRGWRTTSPSRGSDAVMWRCSTRRMLCVNPDRATPMNDLSTMKQILEYMTLAKPIVQFTTREGSRPGPRSRRETTRSILPARSSRAHDPTRHRARPHPRDLLLGSFGAGLAGGLWGPSPSSAGPPPSGPLPGLLPRLTAPTARTDAPDRQTPGDAAG